MPSPPRQTYDPEKISVNTAWMKRGGLHVEVVVEPDEALEFRRTKGESPDLVTCLHAERIFADAKRGLHAKDTDLEQLFGTSDPLVVARILLLNGELQLTAEHRAAMREQKRTAIFSRICQFAVDPKTGLPHPAKRIELAMEEAKIKIDDQHSIEDQVPGIVRQLQPILPIRLEMATLQVHLPAPYGQKLYGELSRHGTMKKTEWLGDGALLAWIELPAGLQTDLIDDLGKRSHGAAEIKRVEGRQA
jgi:ribosome maturation protein SDO1